MHKQKNLPLPLKHQFPVYNMFLPLNNIILITPNVGISSNESYNSEESLERISELLRSFDTGISSLRTKTIAVEEMKKSLPAEVTEKIFADIKKKT